ncbi:MAG: hypothetical protein NTZ69_05100 [Bacteroidia bacterium]|nr:hypothetical protein [Bacteroidia bacterium]
MKTIFVQQINDGPIGNTFGFHSQYFITIFKVKINHTIWNMTNYLIDKPLRLLHPFNICFENLNHFKFSATFCYHQALPYNEHHFRSDTIPNSNRLDQYQVVK